MKNHSELKDTHLHHHIRNRKITFSGNKQLKIYGTLSCASGKRMKKENRVFFASELEALNAGYRPCGHCLNTKYVRWKLRKKQVD